MSVFEIGSYFVLLINCHLALVWETLICHMTSTYISDLLLVNVLIYGSLTYIILNHMPYSDTQ